MESIDKESVRNSAICRWGDVKWNENKKPLSRGFVQTLSEDTHWYYELSHGATLKRLPAQLLFIDRVSSATPFTEKLFNGALGVRYDFFRDLVSPERWQGALWLHILSCLGRVKRRETRSGGAPLKMPNISSTFCNSYTHDCWCKSMRKMEADRWLPSKPARKSEGIHWTLNHSFDIKDPLLTSNSDLYAVWIW